MDERGRVLLAIAREAIAANGTPRAPTDWPEEWLRRHAASFVTLRMHGELRGCIGTIDPLRPLGEDVAHNAHAAAYRDSRFPPVAPTECPRLQVEVSVLSPRIALEASSEDDALGSLRPGIDGVFLEYQQFQATFLPQVWDNLPEPMDFLCELRRKAQLPMRFWHPDIKLSRYTVEKFK